jgi:dienelactone hydrolase
MSRFIACITCLVLTAPAFGRIVTRPVEYKHGDLTLKGYLALDDSIKGKRPGVLVVHEWWGLNDHARRQADRLAELGYVAFALDMFGDGAATDDPHEARELTGRFRNDKKLLVDRARAGLDVLLKDERVDPKRIAAIGYCFGGSAVLQLALSGADLAGVVSFHGGLGGIEYQPGTTVKAKILILHGADDPLIPAEQIAEFQDTLRKAGADWQMVYYGNAVHSFTNEKADGVGMKGVAYHKPTADRSWAAMREFFAEIFGATR